MLQVDFGEFEVTLFKQHVRELVKRTVRRQRTPQRTLLRDKIAFVLGTMGAMCGRQFPAALSSCVIRSWLSRPRRQRLTARTGRLSAYWLGASPETFYRLYTGAAVILFVLRWLIYRTKGCGAPLAPAL